MLLVVFDMCGIIGCIGNEKAAPILIKGLKNLEYRGYDSAGISTISKNNIIIEKDTGKIDEIEKKINFDSMGGSVGISHCRWATHGNVTKENAHPHTDCTGKISIVHNGIIENFSELKDSLIKKGHKFKTSTDTEVIAHLIEEHYNGSIEEAARKTLKEIDGSYALGIVCSQEPDKLIAARNESPLIVGVGEKSMFIASDVPAILDYTNKVAYLEDKELAVLTKNSFKITDLNNNIKNRKINAIEWNKEAAQKSGYKHFMLKEIYEQPKAVEATIYGRLRNGDISLKEEISLSEEQLKNIKKIIIVACGTSWHAGLLGEFMFEELAKIPTEVEYAS